MKTIDFSQYWNSAYRSLQRKQYNLVLLVSIVCFAICVDVYFYHIVDPTCIVLYLFVMPVYLLVIQKLKRDCVYDADKHMVLIYSRKGMLGHLKKLINQSTRRDWYLMGFFWWILGFPLAWCRFCRIRDMRRKV